MLYTQRAAEVWTTEPEFEHHVGLRLQWRHVTVLMDRLDTREERDWYAARATGEGSSRAMREHKIKTNLRTAIGSAPSNFDTALDPVESVLARQLVKAPYVFERLSILTTRLERDVEQALMDCLQDTLMEFLRGMSVVGRQIRLPLKDGGELVINLLLFHVEQLRYVVVELKVGPSMRAHLGELGAYVAAVDGELRRPDIHAPTVGILLCTGKCGAAVQYALASTAPPVAVADYQGRPTRAALPPAGELQAVVDAELEQGPETAR